MYSPLVQLFRSQNLRVYQMKLLCCSRSLNRDICIMLSNIMSSIHCKVLNLVVVNRTCILVLINILNHLRALSIRCLESTFPSTKIPRQDGVIRKKQ
jgi:hypothetical protein